MDYLQSIYDLCKCSVSVDINQHRDNYQTAEQALGDMQAWMNPVEEIGREIIDIMVERNTIIVVRAYPDTPIGSFVVYHYDLTVALKRVYEALINDKT